MRPVPCPRLTKTMEIIPMKVESVMTLPASTLPQAVSPVGAKKGNGRLYGRREDRGATLEMALPAASTTDQPVQRQTQELDEHVIWMDTTSGAVFMIVSPKYCGEVSGLEHVWDRCRAKAR